MGEKRPAVQDSAVDGRWQGALMTANGPVQLHSFQGEHHHGAIGHRNDKPHGNGLLLWFEVDDFDGVSLPLQH